MTYLPRFGQSGPHQSHAYSMVSKSPAVALSATANLRVKNASRIRARFRKGNHSLLMKPTEETAKMLCSVSGRTTENELESLAIHLGSMPDSDLFRRETWHTHYSSIYKVVVFNLQSVALFWRQALIETRVTAEEYFVRFYPPTFVENTKLAVEGLGLMF